MSKRSEAKGLAKAFQKMNHRKIDSASLRRVSTQMGL